MPDNHADMGREHEGRGSEALNGGAEALQHAGTMTRGEVARRLARSVTSVRRYEREGRLMPVRVEGIHRFSRDEVNALAERLREEDEEPVGSKSEIEVRATAVSDLVSGAHDFAAQAFSLLIKMAGETRADSRQTVQALLEENRRLCEREAALESELAKLRNEHRQWEDALAASARADREADQRARRTEILLKGAVDTAKYAAPAIASYVGRLLKVELPESRIAAVQRILAVKTIEERLKLARVVMEQDVLTDDQRARFLENPINFLEIVGELDVGQRAGLIVAIKSTGVFTEPEWATLALLIEMAEKDGETTKAEQVSASDPPPPDTASLEERKAWLTKRSADFQVRMEKELAALDDFAKRLDADAKKTEGSSGG